MKPNEVEHEIMRRNFWCNVFIKQLEDKHYSQNMLVAVADVALEDYDKKFKTLPEVIEDYVNTGPK